MTPVILRGVKIDLEMFLTQLAAVSYQMRRESSFGIQTVDEVKLFIGEMIDQEREYEIGKNYNTNGRDDTDGAIRESAA